MKNSDLKVLIKTCINEVITNTTDIDKLITGQQPYQNQDRHLMWPYECLIESDDNDEVSNVSKQSSIKYKQFIEKYLHKQYAMFYPYYPDTDKVSRMLHHDYKQIDMERFDSLSTESNEITKDSCIMKIYQVTPSRIAIDMHGFGQNRNGVRPEYIFIEK